MVVFATDGHKGHEKNRGYEFDFQFFVYIYLIDWLILFNWVEEATL